jgi:tetratricopeptide (TPR) repeat protein
MTDRQRRTTAVAGLVALAAIVYGPHLDHAFVTDDAIYIVENRAVTVGAPLAAYFTDRATVASAPDFQWQSYRPLRTLAFRGIARVAGVRPLPFALVNLALYLAGALLMMGLGRRLGYPAAGWAAALWVAAPVHVEPVLYASSLGDHLSLALELGGIWLTLAALRLPAGTRWHGRVVAGWLLVTAAMFTKEMAVTAPALMGLVAWGAGVWRGRRAALVIAAQGLGAALFLGARTAVLGVLGHGATTAAGTLAQLAMLPWRLGAYLRIVVAPLGHSAGYVLPSPGAVSLALAWLGFGLVILLLWRAPVLVRLGAGWFVVALLPVLGLVPVFADLADRFALLPSVGLAWIAPVGVAALARRWRPLALVAPALLLAMYAAGTLVEGAAWRDERTLWAKAVALDARSAQAQRNLGIILLQQGEPALALRHFDAARADGELAGELDRRRAMALEELGRFEEAERAVREALARDPELGAAHALLGGLLVRRGALDEAARALEKARRWQPENPSTWLLEIELAAARGDRGRELAAEGQLLTRFPAEPRFHFKRASTLLRTGARAEAAGEARTCLQLAPGQPQCACLLVEVGIATAAERTLCRP